MSYKIKIVINAFKKIAYDLIFKDITFFVNYSYKNEIEVVWSKTKMKENRVLPFIFKEERKYQG